MANEWTDALPDAESAGAPPRWFPPRDEATQVLMVRHGSTVHSHDGRFSGRNDLPLDEHGRRQAHAIAAHIARLPAIDAVVSSPLRRARETAQVLAGRIGGTVEIHEGLMETEFGEWEGLTIEEAHLKWPDVLADWLRRSDVPPPSGESFEQVEKRTMRALDDIVIQRAGQRVVLVSHVTPIKILLRRALGAPQETMFRFHLDTASLSAVDYYRDGTSSVRMINNAEHPFPDG
jgi:probable phosphoglycerate mutase